MLFIRFNHLDHSLMVLSLLEICWQLWCDRLLLMLDVRIVPRYPCSTDSILFKRFIFVSLYVCFRILAVFLDALYMPLYILS